MISVAVGFCVEVCLGHQKSRNKYEFFFLEKGEEGNREVKGF
tara:strand:- start:604 stop:729 length:126 start_codon:yes stop_codon:yes gene_type:complete